MMSRKTVLNRKIRAKDEDLIGLHKYIMVERPLWYNDTVTSPRSIWGEDMWGLSHHYILMP